MAVNIIVSMMHGHKHQIPYNLQTSTAELVYNDFGLCDTSAINAIHSVVKFTLEQATKAQRGSGGMALLFL